MVEIGFKNLNFYSVLALSTHKNEKCYPTMTKGRELHGIHRVVNLRRAAAFDLGFLRDSNIP